MINSFTQTDVDYNSNNNTEPVNQLETSLESDILINTNSLIHKDEGANNKTFPPNLFNENTSSPERSNSLIKNMTKSCGGDSQDDTTFIYQCIESSLH